jgi:hypothetical protein
MMSTTPLDLAGFRYFATCGQHAHRGGLEAAILAFLSHPTCAHAAADTFKTTEGMKNEGAAQQVLDQLQKLPQGK